MTAQPGPCPKCRGQMKAGFLLDKAHYDMVRPTEWLEGNPERSFWSGLKTKGRARFPVRTDRCSSCGYLESYANAD